jgi:hypothetical protein
LTGLDAKDCPVSGWQQAATAVGAIPAAGIIHGTVVASQNASRGCIRINLFSKELRKQFRRRSGMRGDPATQALDAMIADDLRKEGWTITHGAYLPQEELVDPKLISATGEILRTGKRGRRTGSVYPDITAVKNGEILRIQTADTLSNGRLTPREQTNLEHIMQRRPNDRVMWFPKDVFW